MALAEGLLEVIALPLDEVELRLAMLVVLRLEEDDWTEAGGVVLLWVELRLELDVVLITLMLL